MTTIASLLEARRGDTHPGLVERGLSLSWDEVLVEADRRASWLRGIQRDGPPHLGLLMPNGADYLLWLFAAARARWAVVGINPTRRGEALGADIDRTNCQLVITDDEGEVLLAGAPTGLSPDQILHSRDASRRSASLTTGAHEHSSDVAQDDDLLLLLFTSGTTGQPKAVRCTQGRLASIAEIAAPAYGYSRQDVCYCPMPLFHGNALMALVAPALLVGASIALRPRFSASAFLDDVREFGATTFTYVGKAIAYLLAVEEQPEDGSNTLTRGFGTEASSPDRVRFEERFGCRLVEGYGSSEGGVTIVTTPQTPAGALGPAPAGADLAVVDPETGDEMARAIFDEAGVLLNGTEAIGEIVNRAGSGKFEGYYADPLAEGSRVHDGWYWTGDLAYRDSDGYFFFAGRSGDWLRVDSENLAATPIEAVMARFEAFAGVAIYPVPDVSTASGDAVMLAAELRDGTSFDPDAFSAWLGRQSDLGTKWTPSFIRLVDTIDETATGKITKVRLKLERWRCDDVVFIRQDRSTAFLPASAEILDDLDARLAAR